MKINLKKSKLIRAACHMPALKHTWTTQGNEVSRDSDVLRWLSQQEDLQMWMLCILRAGGVIVKSGEDSYEGNTEWDGGDVVFKNGIKSPRRSNKGGRPVKFSPQDILFYMDASEGIDTGDLSRRVISEEGMSKSTFFRVLRQCSDAGLVIYNRGAGGWILPPRPPTSDTTCHSDDCTTAVPTPSETSLS